MHCIWSQYYKHVFTDNLKYRKIGPWITFIKYTQNSKGFFLTHNLYIFTKVSSHTNKWFHKFSSRLLTLAYLRLWIWLMNYLVGKELPKWLYPELNGHNDKCPSGFYTRLFNVFINAIDQARASTANVQKSHKKDGDKLFSRACCDRTRCNCFQVKQGRFRSDIRKNFFIMRIL